MPSALLLRDVTLLALRLDRLAPGLLDGPPPDPALRRHVDDEPRPDPRALLHRARRLRAAVGDADDPARPERHVAAQLTALECRARILAGESVDFVEEVRACFGVQPRPEDPDRYRDTHARLSDLLPGRGSLADRLAAHRAADRVPPERLAGAVAALSEALRATTRDRLGLPDGEDVEYHVVDGRPWSAFTRHLGRGRSRVSVDRSSRPRAGQLLPLVAHEAYPGHHTQYCRADASGVPELRLRLVHSPQGMLAEGAADAGHRVLPGPGWGVLAEQVLSTAGVRLDGPLAEAVESVLDGLGRVRQDAALMRHAHGAGPDDVVAHLRRWLLVDDDRARRMLGFLDHPQWRGYATTYAEGLPLVSAWLARPGADPVTGLRRLLDEPFTPEDLRRDLDRSATAAAPHGGSGPATG